MYLHIMCEIYVEIQIQMFLIPRTDVNDKLSQMASKGKLLNVQIQRTFGGQYQYAFDVIQKCVIAKV